MHGVPAGDDPDITGVDEETVMNQMAPDGAWSACRSCGAARNWPTTSSP